MSEKQAIILIRVSTQFQDFSSQRLDLEKFAQQKGYSNFIVIEAKESGLADFSQREGLKKLYELIDSNPKIDAVFATEMSRLSRKESILHEIKDYFIRKKIQFYLKDSDYCLLDEKTRKPKHDGILFTLYGYFAESEAAIKKDRFARAKKALLENGFSIGGPTLFGFDKIKEEGSKSRLKVNEDQAKQIQTIFNWYLNGIDEVTKNPSIKRISQECIFQGFHEYTHSKRNVNKLLKEEGYLGEKITHNKRKNPEAKFKEGVNPYVVTENKIRYPTQIIPREIFESVQAKLKSNVSEADKTQHSTILAKLIKCPKCGNHLSGNYRTSSKLIRHTYRCTGRSKTIGCDSNLSISMSLLDSAVWSVIKSDYELLKRTISENNPDEKLERIEMALIGIDSKIKTLKASQEEIEESMMRAFRKKRKSLYAQLEEEGDKLEVELKSWESTYKNHLLEKETLINSKEDTMTLLENTIEKIEESQDLLKKFINLFVSNIEILHHNQRFTVISIEFKKTSELIAVRDNNGKIMRYDSEIDFFVGVVLDKRLTLNIKAIKSTTNSSFRVTNGEVFFRSWKDDIALNFQETYRLMEIEEEESVVRFAKILNFNKLNVYQANTQLKANRKDIEIEK
jgi:DNA invertase Pin-like site-specific DNA recombinase